MHSSLTTCPHLLLACPLVQLLLMIGETLQDGIGDHICGAIIQLKKKTAYKLEIWLRDSEATDAIEAMR